MRLLKVLRIRGENFFFHYNETGQLPSYYHDSNKSPDTGNILKEAPVNSIASTNITIVNCIPPYLEHTTKELVKGYKSVDSYYRQGYLLDFADHLGAEQYIRGKFGSKGFRKIRKEFRNLEQKLNIEFKVFYGEIEANTYQFLMETLQRMIQNRFLQKSENHFVINHWQDYKTSIFKMLQEKRASLFVFYKDKTPISISVNYHCNQVLASMMTSFDLDYSRYGPGKLMLLKKIYWCFENGYSKMDLAWGDLPHKRKLANVIYKYKSQVIYRDGNPLIMLAARLISFVQKKKYLINLKKSS